MGRMRAIAGYFKDVVEKQKITISQNVHVRDESGNLMFEEDKATPIMQPMAVEIDADVKNTIWIPQQNIPFTPEEEAEADLEEAEWHAKKAQQKIDELYSAKKSAIDKLTLIQSEKLLMSENDEEAKRAKDWYRMQRAALEAVENIEELDKWDLK